MNLLLKWKIWRIEAGLRVLLKLDGIKSRHVWSFGAYNIDPKYLVFVIGVPTDNEKERLRADSAFCTKMRSLLEKHNWPVAARKHVVFDIESQETVDREENGNWWYHYK
jgi:hypothetical protein